MGLLLEGRFRRKREEGEVLPLELLGLDVEVVLNAFFELGFCCCAGGVGGAAAANDCSGFSRVAVLVCWQGEDRSQEGEEEEGLHFGWLGLIKIGKLGKRM